MMKGFLLLPLALLLTACGVTNTEVIQYREVTVAPPYSTIQVIQDEPVDVTTTTVEYY